MMRSAFSSLSTLRVYRYFEVLTLNLVMPLFFFITISIVVINNFMLLTFSGWQALLLSLHVLDHFLNISKFLWLNSHL